MEGDGVVEEGLWTLGHASPAVVEVDTGLQTKAEQRIFSQKLKLALPLLTNIKNLDGVFPLFAVTNECVNRGGKKGKSLDISVWLCRKVYV